MIDFLAQRQVFFSDALFRLLAFFNVGSRRIPANEASLFVAERVVTDEEPTILTILPQRSLFDLERESTCQCGLALFPQSREIFRMEDSRAEVRGGDIFVGESGIFEDCIVRVDWGAVRR